MSCAGYTVDSPMVIGHESAGVVIEVGKDVKSCKVGDEVALEPGVACGRCSYCKGGRYNLCPEMAFFATPPVHGSLAHQIVHPEDLCFPLPPGVSLEEGAMCEPLSVGVHACKRAGSLAAKRVAVLGAGPIGLVTLLVAQAFGASKVVIADAHAERLCFARKLGATAVTEMSHDAKTVDMEAERITRALGGQVDVVFDCVGVEKTMQVAMQACSSGGRVMLVGMGHTHMNLPMTGTAAREVDVVGVFRYANTYPLCLELLQSRKIDVKPLITHRFGFSQEEVLEAFKTSARGGDAIKVMFKL